MSEYKVIVKKPLTNEEVEKEIVPSKFLDAFIKHHCKTGYYVEVFKKDDN